VTWSKLICIWKWKWREGKATSSQNAFRRGIRPLLRELAKVLREQESQLGEL